MEFTTFDGLRIAYRRDGAGPALVLVHGTGGDSLGNWDGVTGDLAADHTVIRPDYSGSGETEDDGRPLSVETFAAQVLAAVDHAGFARFALVGFSLGAAVALQIAADHPDRVSALVLIAGFAAPDPRLRLQFELWRELIASDRAAMARLVLLTGFSPQALSSWGDEGVGQALRDTIDGQNWPGMARQTEVDLALDVSPAIARISAPTLAIGCSHDHMVPPAHSRALAAAIPGASYAELPTGTSRRWSGRT